MIKNKKTNLLTSALAFIIIGVFVLSSVYNVNAGSADGSGGRATSPGLGTWFVVEGKDGTREAWNKFLQKQARNQGGETRVTNIVNMNNNQGFKRPDGTYEDLATSCKRSQYIWYYANGSRPGYVQISKRGAVPVRYDYYETGDWFSAGGSTNNAPQRSDVRDSSKKNRAWNEYLANPNSKWASGRVVIVCSASSPKIVTDKFKLEVTAGTQTFLWDDTYHTINYNHDKISKGKLASGHTLTTTTNVTKKNEGIYPVPVKGVKIVDSAGKNVNSQYAIRTHDGKLTIKSEIGTDERIKGRCVADRWEGQVKGPIWADVIANPVFEGEPGKLQSQPPAGGISTELGDYFANGSFENIKTLSQWRSWSQSFNHIKNYGNTRTPSLTLSDINQSGLSKYGGVINVTRRYRDGTANVMTCQPQDRDWITTYSSKRDEDGELVLDRNGNEIKEVSGGYFTDWYDVGERQVKRRERSTSNGDSWHYQILSVNCNKPELDAAAAASNLQITKKTMGDGSGSGLLETESTKNINELPFGRTDRGNSALNRTGKIEFYTDGESCSVFTCAADPLTDSKNDAVNNSGENPLFREIDEDNEDNEGLPRRDEALNKDYLVFFRDNADRKIKADLWYPKDYDANGLKVEETSPVVKTWGKIAKGGTPELGITTISKFGDEANNIKSVDKEHSWNGEALVFNMKSQWASEEGKPYELGLSWQYEANAENIMPTIVNGFSIQSYNKAGTENKYSYKFPVVCEFNNDLNSSPKAIIADRPYANAGFTKNKFPTLGTNAIRALFTRAVSDVD